MAEEREQLPWHNGKDCVFRLDERKDESGAPWAVTKEKPADKYAARTVGYRQVVIDGTRYVKEFPISAHNKISKIVGDLMIAQSNPFNVWFEMSFDASQKPSDKYTIKLIPAPDQTTLQPAAVEVPVVATPQPTTDPATSGMDFGMVTGQVIEPTVSPEEEKFLTDAMAFPQKLTKDQFMTLVEGNAGKYGIEVARGESLYSSYSA